LRRSIENIPDFASFPASLLASFGTVRLANPEKAGGAVEAAPDVGVVSGFFGRLANNEGVPEAGGVVEAMIDHTN